MDFLLVYLLVGLFFAVLFRVYTKKKQSALTLVLAALVWPVLPLTIAGVLFVILLAPVVNLLAKVKV